MAAPWELSAQTTNGSSLPAKISAASWFKSKLWKTVYGCSLRIDCHIGLASVNACAERNVLIFGRSCAMRVGRWGRGQGWFAEQIPRVFHFWQGWKSTSIFRPAGPAATFAICWSARIKVIQFLVEIEIEIHFQLSSPYPC